MKWYSKDSFFNYKFVSFQRFDLYGGNGLWDFYLVNHINLALNRKRMCSVWLRKDKIISSQAFLRILWNVPCELDNKDKRYQKCESLHMHKHPIFILKGPLRSPF